MKNIYDLKKKIKEEIIIQRDLKDQRKQNYKGKRSFKDGYGTAQEQASIASVDKKQELRFLHLAYGQLRGRTIEQMESKVREENELLEYDYMEIEGIMEQYNEKREDSIRISA